MDKRVAAVASMRHAAVGMGLSPEAAEAIFAIDYETLTAFSKRQFEVRACKMRQEAKQGCPQTAAAIWLNMPQSSEAGSNESQHA